MDIAIRRYQQLLATYLRPHRGSVALLALLLFGSIALQLANPQVVRFFIDTTQSGGQRQALVFAALLFVVIALTQSLVALGALYWGQKVGWGATNALRSDLTRHCLRLDMPFHKRRTPGELIERIDGDVAALANFFSQFVIRVAGNGFLILGILVLLFREDWRVGVGLACYTLLTFVALGAVQKMAVGRWAAARQASAEHFGFIEERLSGTEDIRANGGEPYVLRELYRLMRNMLQKEWSARWVSHLTFIGTNVLFVVGYVVGLGTGAFLYTRGDVTIGTAYLIVYYIGMLSGPLESIRAQSQDLQVAAASIDRVQELFDARPDVREVIRAALPAGTLAVEFNDVSFSYQEDLPSPADGEVPVDTRPAVVKHLSFRLAPGEVLGLLGRTGSGKTTLTRLLFRLYDPSGGTITVGGVDIRDVALADLRARVGMVTQDVQLFQASIRDNLTFFNLRIPDEQIEHVLDDLGMGAWVRALPRGLDTMLGAGGQGLSSGEAQLLAFARVFLRDPGLVLLDEASSRLDPATERLLEHAIDRLLVQRTAIVIAHRLQTVQRVDTIMILEDGKVMEYGPREQLAADANSRFFHLLQTGLEEVVI